MQKPPEISFRQLEGSQHLESLIRNHVARLERYHPRIIGCRVVVEATHRPSGEGTGPIGVTVEVEVPARKKIVVRDAERPQEAHNNRRALVNRVFDVVRRRLEDTADIQRGATKTHAGQGETGVISEIFPEQNGGFVEVANSPALYFTRNAVDGDAYDALEPGMTVLVTRATGEGPMGPQASSVRLLNARRTGT